MRPVTYTTMIACGASFDGVVYGVFRAPLHYRRGKPDHINLHKGTRLAVYKHQDGPLDAPLFEMSQRHETADAPAFEWAMIHDYRRAFEPAAKGD